MMDHQTYIRWLHRLAEDLPEGSLTRIAQGPNGIDLYLDRNVVLNGTQYLNLVVRDPSLGDIGPWHIGPNCHIQAGDGGRLKVDIPGGPSVIRFLAGTPVFEVKGTNEYGAMTFQLPHPDQ